MLSLMILIPLACIVFLNLFSKEAMKKVAFGIAVLLSLAQVYVALSPTALTCCPLNGISAYFNFSLHIDGLSRVLLLCIGIVVFTALLAGRHFIKDDNKQFYFINLILIELAGLNGVVMVRDIFSMYVFLEVAAVASFIMIALEREKLALEGAFKYLVFSAVATVFMLSAVALMLLVSGGTSFDVIKAALQGSSHSSLIIFAVGIFLAGLFMKAGIMPFHGYLPDAYTAAPAPVSILLAGIVTKTLGVYTLMRIVLDVFGFTPQIKHVLMFIGILSIVLAALAALGQKDLKRLLSYSSISQIGYIILSFSCGTALGIAGAIFHLFNHAIFKSLLFVNAAAVEERTGLRNMEDMGGLSSRMPLTGTTSVLAALSTAGIPPLAGFWSKLVIILALWQVGYYTAAVIAVLASLLTLSYMLYMQRSVFFGQLKEGFARVEEAGFGLSCASVVLALIVVGVGLFFPLIVNTIILPVAHI